MRRATLALSLLLGVAAACGASQARTLPAAKTWPLFGYDSARHGVGPAVTGITAANVRHLAHRRITLDGTLDSSPIYLDGTLYLTTTYGRTEAIDPGTGTVRWRFTPPAYASFAGTAQITNATPAADPSGTAIYAGAPDGVIRKLRASDGKVLWATSITRDPTHEKLTSSLNVSHGLVIAATGGYIGDAPPYQGHVVTLDARTGRIRSVWNSLCSDRRTIIQPSTCAASDSAIWSRNGAAVDPSDGNLVVSTGNGPWNGTTNWGDSVLVLSPDASRLVAHWTPANQAEMNRDDADLGSTSPGLLPNGYAIQGGKDGIVRLLQLHGTPRLVQQVPAPGPTDVFAAPAIWQGRWVFVATGAGLAAFRFRGGRLHRAWSNGIAGTSPVVAGGLLYVAGYGALHVYAPTTGRVLASLPTGPVHWQSPVVVDGTIALGEGNANSHATSGVLDVFRVR
jgi:outer membrane protein assembly factor BamB